VGLELLSYLTPWWVDFFGHTGIWIGLISRRFAGDDRFDRSTDILIGLLEGKEITPQSNINLETYFRGLEDPGTFLDPWAHNFIRGSQPEERGYEASVPTRCTRSIPLVIKEEILGEPRRCFSANQSMDLINVFATEAKVGASFPITGDFIVPRIRAKEEKNSQALIMWHYVIDLATAQRAGSPAGISCDLFQAPTYKQPLLSLFPL